MNQQNPAVQWFEGQQLLILGGDLVSEHLLWILRNAIDDVDTGNQVRLLSLRETLPVWIDNKGNSEVCFGLAHNSCNAIAVNILEHVESALEVVKGDEGRYTSIKMVILKALIDTVVHETTHINGMSEEEARKVAGSYGWRIGETLDCELATFGDLIEQEIAKHAEDWRKSANDPDTPPEDWELIQLHMFDNHLTFYNPFDGGIELKSYRRCMEHGAPTETAWISVEDSRFRKFHIMTPSTVEKVAGSVNVTKPEEMKPAQPTMDMNTFVQQQQETFNAGAQSDTYESYSDDSMDGFNPLDDPGGHTSDFLSPAPVVANQPVGQVQQAVSPTAVSPSATLYSQSGHAMQETSPEEEQELQRARILAEQVYRRLFQFVYTHCQPNGQGGFNNIGQVLQPVPIGDIPGANELIVMQNYTDAMGVGHDNQAVNGAIHGSITPKANLPCFRFTMKVGEHMISRTLLAQNPNTGSTWAKAVREGTFIMSVLPPQGKPVAVLKLAPGAQPGQETYDMLS